MVQCPKCSAKNQPEHRFCHSCGEELSSVSQMPTMEAPEGEVPQPPIGTLHVGRIVSSDSVPAGGFTPGTILADRYRIIGLLGRGGMGEVYRADDLKLGQPVALKFLPPALAEDSVRRERFFAEVRITRQLSHPNICRVYDIGEVDGRHFLSMEYIDGEDLASLMKRIGSLTNEKALDIARQLVAGLSVAHERGVLHRDLKPANIMLDGHGRVRITDFGLAIAVEDESQVEEIAGTPAYMAPEQLAGKGATVRSDIYSLGLILYEIYTGKKAFKANTLAELREQKETTTPRAPSEIREGIDTVVERVIQRCMEKDPNSRPASVAQLAGALPGGDPLAAAIAAGETPSPEMVAASGSKEGFRPIVAWGLLVFIIAGMTAAFMMKDRILLHERIPFQRSPEELKVLSQQLLEKIGITDEYADSAYGFKINTDLLDKIEKIEPAKRQEKLDSKAILFWYRQSPRLLGLSGFYNGGTSPVNPPMQYPGEVLVEMDTEGHLLSLLRIPSQDNQNHEYIKSEVWESLFSQAGLDISNWNPTDSIQIPSTYADSRVAWTGSFPNWPDVQVRIEAAAFQGKPVKFQIIGLWKELIPVSSEELPTGKIPILFVVALSIGMTLFTMISTIGGILLARRNLKLGRGDRRSAKRLAVFILSMLVLGWILQLPNCFFAELLIYPYTAALVGILYIAIEPFMRRQWPQLLVSWTRLLSGNWRDTLIARDAFVGSASAVLFICILFCTILITGTVKFPTSFRIIDSFLGTRFTINVLLQSFMQILPCMAAVCLLVVLKVLLRNKIAAVVLCILINSSLVWSWGIVLAFSWIALFYILLFRFGFVAGVFYCSAAFLLYRMFVTLQPSAWYAGYGYLSLIIIATIFIYVFRTSLGGRPMFGTARLDE